MIRHTAFALSLALLAGPAFAQNTPAPTAVGQAPGVDQGLAAPDAGSTVKTGRVGNAATTTTAPGQPLTKQGAGANIKVTPSGQVEAPNP